LLLKSIDYGRMAEILVQMAGSSDEFTRLTAITWVNALTLYSMSIINEFVKLGGDQLMPYYADILGAILPCISDKEEKIRVVSWFSSFILLELYLTHPQCIIVYSLVEVKCLKLLVKQMMSFEQYKLILHKGLMLEQFSLMQGGAIFQLSSESEATQIEALHWISALLNRHQDDVLNFLDDIFDSLLKALSDPSDQVVLLVLEVHACIAEEPQYFRQLVVFLMHNFRIDISLLEKRGALTIQRLCVLLDAEKVYRELSKILEGEADLDFASMMVKACSSRLQFSTALVTIITIFWGSEFSAAQNCVTD
ncbi:Protein VAC14 homolog, partial [Linum perenne]